MQVLKFIILLTIILLSTAVGVLISSKYSKRVEELKEIKNALNMLETKIKFTYEPLAGIFEQISQTLSVSIRNIFSKASENMKTMQVKQAWNNSIDEALLSLNSEDINILKKLGNMLRKD